MDHPIGKLWYLMYGVGEKLKATNERWKAYQWCKNIEQEQYENEQILCDMMKDVSKHHFVELVLTVNSTLQSHQRFAEIAKFKTSEGNRSNTTLQLGQMVTS